MSAVVERTFTVDRNLAHRADSKLRRYGTDINHVLSSALMLVVSSRGLPEVFAPVPPVLEFEVQGRKFVADITPCQGGGYCAVVRGHENCYTEGDTLAELKQALVEVTELVLFDIADERFDA